VAAADRRSVEIFGVHGELRQRLSAPRASFTAATWTHDGDGVFATGVATDTLIAAVFRLGLDGSQRQVWSVESRAVMLPVLSPDGQRLALTLISRRANAWLLME